MRGSHQAICYILPEYRSDTDTHFFYLYDFLESVGKRSKLFVVIEKGAPPADRFKDAARVYRLTFSALPLRFLELLYVLLAARLAGCRAFYTHYSYAGAIAAGIVSRISGATSYYWNCGMPWLFGSQYGLRFAIRASHRLVTGTETMAELYAGQLGVRSEKIRVMPNWIDLGRFEDSADIPDEKRNSILFVHRLSSRKGADLLPDIVERAGEDARFVIAGDGPLRAPLAKEFLRRGLSDRVRMEGAVPHARIPELFGRARLFIMPSREEGFPHVILEAMASGTPFVATDVGGVRDIVPDEVRGSLQPTGDASTFAEEIVRMLTEPARRARARQAGLSRVRHFEKDAVVERFVTLMATDN